MTNVITIHNAVNERCWQEVMKWEQLHKVRLRAFSRARLLASHPKLRSLFGSQRENLIALWTLLLRRRSAIAQSC